MLSSTSASLCEGGGPGRNKLLYGVNSGSHSVTLGVAADPGLRERTRWGKPQYRRGKYSGSTMEGAEPLSPALPALYWWWCSGSCGQNCAVRKGWGSQESVVLKLDRSGVEGGPQAALRLDSLCPSHTGHVPRQSEVENRHIKEVTDTFTLVQVVDVIMISGGRRKAEKRGKHF